MSNIQFVALELGVMYFSVLLSAIALGQFRNKEFWKAMGIILAIATPIYGLFLWSVRVYVFA